jgi:hypothetical protein
METGRGRVHRLAIRAHLPSREPLPTLYPNPGELAKRNGRNWMILEIRKGQVRRTCSGILIAIYNLSVRRL